ncbi:Acetyltransferase [Tenacibaculum sp. 190130A14a]|uniref:N-acetyltransferase n=1 Tax=Tenacibaculum polynesiense TaxID=3137857 RepID=A0ABM9P8A0_9FLAO
MKKEKEKIEFRIYSGSHKEEIIRIFRSNCPKYFNINDEENLVYFLDNFTDENYLVALQEGKVIGCGGHYTKENMHGIAWVMFEKHSLGANKILNISDLFYQEIENRIISEGKLFPILINTTQLMERLFNRYGFKTYEVIKDGFGKGLDEYKMKKLLK